MIYIQFQKVKAKKLKCLRVFLRQRKSDSTDILKTKKLLTQGLRQGVLYCEKHKKADYI